MTGLWQSSSQSTHIRAWFKMYLNTRSSTSTVDFKYLFSFPTKLLRNGIDSILLQADPVVSSSFKLSFKQKIQRPENLKSKLSLYLYSILMISPVANSFARSKPSSFLFFDTLFSSDKITSLLKMAGPMYLSSDNSRRDMELVRRSPHRLRIALRSEPLPFAPVFETKNINLSKNKVKNTMHR